MAAVEAFVESEAHFRFRGSGPRRKERRHAAKRVFVAMPFDKRFEDTYYLGIVPPPTARRPPAPAPTQPRFHQHILDIIHGDISSADLVVADLSGANPNVTYEMGYAHGLKKPMIHISTTAPEELPFDFKQWPIVVYEIGKSARAARAAQCSHGRAIQRISLSRIPPRTLPAARKLLE